MRDFLLHFKIKIPSFFEGINLVRLSVTVVWFSRLDACSFHKDFGMVFIDGFQTGFLRIGSWFNMLKRN